MPNIPPHPCPDCTTLTTTRRCPDCTTKHRRLTHNPHRSAIYHSKRWHSLRRQLLADHPYCPCGALATQVDHIHPLRDDGDPYDQANLQTLCASCHSRKTASEVGWAGR